MAVFPFDGVDWSYWQSSAAIASHARDGEVRQTLRYTLIDIGAPISEFNYALVRDPESDLLDALDAAERFFGAKQHPYRVVFRAEHAEPCAVVLREHGLRAVDLLPGMQIATATRAPAPPAGLDVRVATDAASLRDFGRTVFSGFGLPEHDAHLFLTEHLRSCPSFVPFVGYVGRTPVCASSLLVNAHVAGIYWVATRDGFRRRGFGTAITWAAIVEGARRGCGLASLQASAMGRPVYAQMGFDHDRSYARFEPLAASSAVG